MSTQPSQPLIGFLGLGAMGAPMVRCLLKAGYAVRAYDPATDRLQRALADGATAAGGAAELVAGSDVICTSLPSHEVFVAVAEKELLPSARPGQVFVDLGTTIPFETRRLGAVFAIKGATLLDVPVSGGVDGAERGRLRMFAGGDRQKFEVVRPVLEAIGGAEKLTYCGPSGSGQIAKGVNQIKSALNTAAYLEALAFAVRAGVPAETIAAAFGAGSAEEASGIVKYARKVAANPAAHFGVKFRELPYFLAEARERGFELPLTAALHAFCDRGERVVLDDNRPAPSFWHELRRS